MPIRVSQTDYVTRVTQGVQTKSGNYAKGVQGSTADWAGNSIAALPRMLAGIQQAMSDGRIQDGINAVGTAGWKSITVAKASNWSNSFTNPITQQHIQQGAAKLYNMLNTALSVVDAMPRGDLGANLARANAFATSLWNQKRGL